MFAAIAAMVMVSVSNVFASSRMVGRQRRINRESVESCWYHCQQDSTLFKLSKISIKECYDQHSTSSILTNLPATNCMMILWSVVPWRRASTLGAMAYRLICSSASCHCTSALESLPSSGFAS